MLRNNPLQRNGRQIPNSDDGMNNWCVKTRQDREDYGFMEKALKTKLMVYCRTNLQISKALRNINHFLKALKWEKPADWLANTKTSKCRVF